MRKLKNENGMLNIISDILVKTGIERIEPEGLKNFVQELTEIKQQRRKDNEYFSLIFASLFQMITTESKQVVIDFSGDDQSGILVKKNQVLPSGGFCFFGWIRINIINQEIAEKPMIIFKFSSIRLKNIELSYYKGKLIYSVIYTLNLC